MVVADTNVIVESIRGNVMAQQLLKKYSAHGIYISVITEIELNIGATNLSKKNLVKAVLKEHEILPLSRGIGEIASRLIYTHNNNKQVLYLGDSLIAATCLHYGYNLITFNTKDFKMIKGLQLAK